MLQVIHPEDVLTSYLCQGLPLRDEPELPSRMHEELRLEFDIGTGTRQTGIHARRWFLARASPLKVTTM